jgi:hypothetical protein
MTIRPRSHALVSAALVAATTATLLTSGAWLTAAHADDYPSWDEVQAAKADASSTQAEADRIGALLGELESGAARLGDDAVSQAAAADSAARAAENAASGLADLQARASAAESQAAEAKRQAGAVSASLARAGDPVLDLWLSGGTADSMLSRIGTMTKVTESLGQLRSRAAREQKLAESLADQAAVATAERDRLAADARAGADSSAAAQQTADAQLADAQARSATLYEQLAVLKDSSADLEREYRAGQQQAASYASGNGGGSGSVSGGASGSQPSGDSGGAGGADSGGQGDELGSIAPGAGVLSPADARAYAAGRVAARGWGDSENQCLVWLWTRESSWRWNAYNASSGAYGIPQSLPGSKMASAGADWRTSASTQIEWGLGYIASRYGTPCAAWAHSEDIGWY